MPNPSPEFKLGAKYTVSCYLKDKTLIPYSKAVEVLFS